MKKLRNDTEEKGITYNLKMKEFCKQHIKEHLIEFLDALYMNFRNERKFSNKKVTTNIRHLPINWMANRIKNEVKSNWHKYKDSTAIDGLFQHPEAFLTSEFEFFRELAKHISEL